MSRRITGTTSLEGRKLEHALSADFFIAFSLKLFAYVLSIGIGMSMWVWIDDESHLIRCTPRVRGKGGFGSSSSYL